MNRRTTVAERPREKSVGFGMNEQDADGELHDDAVVEYVDEPAESILGLAEVLDDDGIEPTHAEVDEPVEDEYRAEQPRHDEIGRAHV